jgi:transcriptional regulator with XRE-family HTH domain
MALYPFPISRSRILRKAKKEALMDSKNITAIKLAETLGALIDKGAWSRKELCEKVEITQSLLSQYISGTTMPSLQKAVDLAQCLNVSLDYLVFGESSSTVLTGNADNDPLAGHIEKILMNARVQSESHADLVIRIGQAIANLIDKKAEELQHFLNLNNEGVSIPGIWSSNQMSRLESYSEETYILTTDLKYNVMIEGDEVSNATPGSFFHVVVQNLLKGRTYRFLLPNGYDNWALKVRGFYALLRKNRGVASHLGNIKFRCTDSPIITGCGFYKLDKNLLQKNEPLIFERISTAMTEDRWIGYSMPPSDYVQADLQMDVRRLEHARQVFESLWRKASDVS